jgi:hypothetical protein
VQDGAASPHNPATSIIIKINMNQLGTAWRFLSCPGFAAVVCVDENAINHAISFTD